MISEFLRDLFLIIPDKPCEELFSIQFISHQFEGNQFPLELATERENRLLRTDQVPGTLPTCAMQHISPIIHWALFASALLQKA